MPVKMYDVSHTGQKYNEREVEPTSIPAYCEKFGLVLRKAAAGTWTWNLYRGGVLVGVVELPTPDRVETNHAANPATIRVRPSFAPLSKFAHLLHKASKITRKPQTETV